MNIKLNVIDHNYNYWYEKDMLVDIIISIEGLKTVKLMDGREFKIKNANVYIPKLDQEFSIDLALYEIDAEEDEFEYYNIKDIINPEEIISCITEYVVKHRNNIINWK